MSALSGLRPMLSIAFAAMSPIARAGAKPPIAIARALAKSCIVSGVIKCLSTPRVNLIFPGEINIIEINRLYYSEKSRKLSIDCLVELRRATMMKLCVYMDQRGIKAANVEGGLPEIISPYLLNLIEKTGGADGPIGRQFVANPEKEKEFRSSGARDPFAEDAHEVAPGLVYRYRGKIKPDGSIEYFGRGLWTVSRHCASYCRFCFRGREVGAAKNNPNSKAAIARSKHLSDAELSEVFEYISGHPELNEIIVSGGDPFFVPKEYFEKIVTNLARLQAEGKLDIIRFGTRLPVQNPRLLQDWHYTGLASIKNPYILLHINHPAELTDETLAVLYRFRKETMATILSHTVLLRGVNDSVEILQELLNKLTIEGVRPYYLFQNDPVYWAKHFTVPTKEAFALWAKLRPRLSGLAATVKFTIEKKGALGKIPVPEAGAWDFDESGFRDFSGKWVDSE